MVSASFVQTSFLGGQWSALAQGRMTDPDYKSAMNVCFNGYPLEASSWTRRQGFRYLAHTKTGKAGILRAFDFSVTQPYQMEFTDGFVRFFAGLALVTFDDVSVPITHISSANPAVVYASAIPDGWADGATVIFDIGSIPCTTTFLCGRQFVIDNLDTGAQTFTLKDAITGAAINGADIDYQVSFPNVGTIDTAKRVFELATPYTSGAWSTLRTVQDNVSVLLLHGSYQPRSITRGVTPAPFQIATQDFLDGPYLDINTTSTTLTPSGTTGSITITASAHTGINGNEGFLSTDVGRLIRFQCAPPAWAIGTTYAKAATVLGSDNNIYDSLTGGNIGNDPTTDDGTNWELNEAEVIWVWMKITAVTDGTHVTATVMDAAAGITDDNVPSRSLPSTVASSQWRLGAFSDTTGWPKCGVYHEGRLWLSGVIGNRFDASFSNDHFNFSPTSSDGTVSDANAISEILNAKDVNEIFWMLSTGDGVIMGTQAGEWRIRASVLDDPISPTSIQARCVSKYGCANVEPVEASLPVFVQRQQRKMLAHMPVSDTKYLGGNLTRNADDMTVSGVAEIRWQQEPNLTVWARRNDGVLMGSVFQRVPNYSQFGGKDDSFNGFHIHSLGSGRVFDSISSGPAFDGLSDALYAVTNKTVADDPDYNVHWVECLMPLFDSSQPDWSAFFVDGGTNPCCAKVMATTRGDTFDGVRLYGLWSMNGLTIAPVLGGLDLGDRLVSNGYVDVPYLSDPEKAFTLAFLQAQNNGTDYGTFETDYEFQDTIGGIPAVFPANSEGAYRNAANPHTYNLFAVDFKIGAAYGVNLTDDLFDVYNYADWTLTKSVALSTYLGGLTLSSFHTLCVNEEDGNTYIATDGAIAQIDPGDYSQLTAATTGVGGLAPDATGFLPIGKGQMAVVGVTSINTQKAVTILNTDTMTWPIGLHFVIDEDQVVLCTGPGTVFFGIGVDNGSGYDVGQTIGLYVFDAAWGFGKSGNIAPSDIDPTWTQFFSASVPAYDAKDGTILVSFQSETGPTNTIYLVKMKPYSKTIVWKVAMPSMAGWGSIQARKPIETLHVGWMGGEDGLYLIDTVAGTYTVTAFSPILLAQGTSYFDAKDGGCLQTGTEATWTVTVPNLLGPYSPAHETVGIDSDTTGKFYFGLDGDDFPETVVYKAATSAGASYTSKGQLLRPDYGVDAGARNGPAFGKKRRLHWWSAAFERARNVIVGTIFNARVMRPVSFASEAGTPLAAPGLFSGTRTNTIDNDESFDAQIAWQISRPYPCVITAVGGYIESTDK